jgi:hypothetical protein
MIMLLVLPALVYMVLIQGPGSDLSAVEIPMSLLIGPALSGVQNLPVTLDRDYTTSSVENPFDAFPGEMADTPFGYVETRDEYYSHTYYSETMPADAAFHIDDILERPESIAAIGTITDDSETPSPATADEIAPEENTPRVDQPSPEDPFIPIIMKAAREHQVDPDIIKAIIKAESGYNPKAVSKAGAKGLMQLMPRTAKSLGVKDSFCPEQNILAGVKYFKQLLNQFKGDVRLALAAYNAGSRKVRKYRGIPPFKNTRIYIKKVFEYHKEYKQEVFENG